MIQCVVFELSFFLNLIAYRYHVSSCFQGSSDWEPEVSGDFGARIWNPDLIQEGHWHHLALVWSRAVLKNSQFCLYIDGQLVYSGKVRNNARSHNVSCLLIHPAHYYLYSIIT